MIIILCLIAARNIDEMWLLCVLSNWIFFLSSSSSSLTDATCASRNRASWRTHQHIHSTMITLIIMMMIFETSMEREQRKKNNDTEIILNGQRVTIRYRYFHASGYRFWCTSMPEGMSPSIFEQKHLIETIHNFNKYTLSHVYE